MLTGREAEQRRIDQLLQQGVAGSGGVLTLCGDPGIGKTALLDYAASRAGPMRILRTTGTEAENELGFAGLYSLLHPVADYLDGLPEPQAAALRSALGIGYHEARSDRLAVAAGTHSLLTTVAEDFPLLILVDDLHWLDPASHEALLFALRRLDRDPVACLLPLRSGTAVPAGLPCLEVTGLDSDAAGCLVEAVAGIAPAPEVAQRLHAETGGNALALVELSVSLTAGQLAGAEHLEAPLEPGAAIRQRFAVRLNQLSPSSRTVLLVAAAAGRCLPAEVHAAVARLDAADGNALDEAEATGLIRLSGTGIEFSHPLLRSVAYHMAVPAQRRAAHLALAETLTGTDLASAWCDAGRPDRASGCTERAVELARSQGLAGLLPRALAWASWLDGERGLWSRALAFGSQALDLALATGQTYLACYAYATLANIEAAQGRDEDCLRHAHEAERIAGELGLRKLEVQAYRARALLDLGRGRLEEAIVRYEELRRLVADAGIAHPYYSTVPDLVEAYARSGAVERARAVLPEFLAQVPGHANPQSAARAERCRGLVADDFDPPFLEAIALHERGDVVFQHARTHLVYGERLRRAQRRRDARVQLRAAAEIFDRLDARPWAERARAELRASGETLASGGDGTEQLTPQELQIALLVTEGRTNAEVGRALFLSTRTVEFHLSRAYRKLGVASRTELTRRFASVGTVPG